MFARWKESLHRLEQVGECGVRDLDSFGPARRPRGVDHISEICRSDAAVEIPIAIRSVNSIQNQGRRQTSCRPADRRAVVARSARTGT